MLKRSEDEWREILPPDVYHILREEGTEAPFSGIYVDMKTPGVYRCAGCRALLFSSDDKYDSGSGWPSFTDVIGADAIRLAPDDKLGYVRTGVNCSSCGGHLGHVFEDGPAPTGKRYCINSLALILDPSSTLEK